MVVKYFRLAFQPRTKRWIVTTARSCRISFCLRCLARYILMIAWNTKHLHTDGQTIGHVSSNLHHFILFNQKNLYLFPFNYVLFLLREFFFYVTFLYEMLFYLYYHSATTQGNKMPALQNSFKPALDSYYTQHDSWMEGLVQENFFRFSEENLVKETNIMEKFCLKKPFFPKIVIL